MRKHFVFILLGVTLIAVQARADRGSIPFTPHVRIFEPVQRAMIAWNGHEEILLLSTDLRASEPTKVLEVMPFPDEPVVKKGDVDVFRRATRLINEKIRRPALFDARGKGVEREMAAAGEVTFHKKIGAHDISVTRVVSCHGFISWVENYLECSGVDNPHIPELMKEIVEDYLSEGFKWFVFDVVELDRTLKTNDAIQYRFKSRCLYYPMKISRVEEGDTSVDLLILTPKLLSRFPGIPASRIELRHEPVSLTSSELRSLNREMDRLLGHRDDMKLRIWRIHGELFSFNDDLIAY